VSAAPHFGVSPPFSANNSDSGAVLKASITPVPGQQSPLVRAQLGIANHVLFGRHAHGTGQAQIIELVTDVVQVVVSGKFHIHSVGE
jgi:hypothetical protein